MYRQLITAPTIEPVTLEEVYEHTHADSDHEAYLSTLIPMARTRFEQHTGRLLVEQTWQIALPKFSSCIKLPFAPLQSVQAISFINTQVLWEDLQDSDYRIIPQGLTASLMPAIGSQWPQTGIQIPDGVQIQCKFGHAPLTVDGSAIDTDNITDLGSYQLAKQAILILIADWFRNREDTAPVQLYHLPNAFGAICSELAVSVL